MNDVIIAPLEQRRRDALVAYYLGQLVGENAVPHNVASAEDLYEYLLIDNQVSGQVDTSRVAQGIASVQQHVHAIYNGMEPGFERMSSNTQARRLWSEGMARYSQWSGYQSLEDYPENYLDPSLRLGKTELFKTLEGELAQARLSVDTVQKAVENYLQQFEEVSNLQVISCFISGNDHLNADYYLLGQERVEPYRVFWRTFKLSDNNGDPLGTAWTEWRPVENLQGAHIKLCRLAVFEGRLYVVWVTSRQKLTTDQEPATGAYLYQINMTRRKLNGGWDAPHLLHEVDTGLEDMPVESAEDGTLRNGCLLAVTTRHFDNQGNCLLIEFCPFKDGEQLSSHEVVAFDTLLRAVDISEQQGNLFILMELMHGRNPHRAHFPIDSLVVENGVLGWRVVSVEFDRGHPETVISSDPFRSVNGWLMLNVDWVGRTDARGVLVIEGGCNRPVLWPVNPEYSYSFEWGYFPGFAVSPYSPGFYSSVRCKDGQATWHIGDRSFYSGTGTPHVYRLKWRDLEAVVSADDPLFQKIPGDRGLTVREGDFLLPDSFVGIDPGSSEEIVRGSGFSIELQLAGESSAYFPAVSSNNRYQLSWGMVAAEFKLAQAGQEGSGLKELLTLNGGARTSRLFHAWEGTDTTRTFIFGASREPTVYGVNAFTVTRTAIVDSLKAPSVQHQAPGAQFLMVHDATGAPRYIRLNTLFAKMLTRKANRSLESVFEWETQHTEEPPYPDETDATQLDFNGANSLYFWELFFHVPHLIASRLQREFDYLGAERWLHKLFNPLVRNAPLYPPPRETDWLPYWTCRPLGFQDHPAPELEGLADPDAIARGAPSHYRKAIFMLYLNNLIAWGDMLYRQVTRDTLNEAKLLYVRALSLLGPLSKGRSISRWQPAPLGDVVGPENHRFAAFESSTDLAVPELPWQTTQQSPWLRLLDIDAFRLPVNTQLLDLWDRLDLRLHNLRHNLTLDGKPLQLALYEAPANPLDLLRAQQAGSSLSQRRLGSLAIIPPYRFRAMLPRVQNAVETLIGFGERVRLFMESRDRAQQDELQQGHVLELAKFTENIQQELIEQAIKGLEVLQANRASVEARRDYYQGLVDEDVSPLERKAHDNQMAAKSLSYAARHTSAAGQLATLAPNLFGMTTGGMNWGGPMFATAEELEAKALFDDSDAQVQLNSDVQKRRREEWTFQAEQAELEMEALDRQIEAQRVMVRSASTSLKQSSKALEQSQALYAFLKNRPAGVGLYQWLLSQMSTLYFQAYDAVLAMCLSTEACWQYEIGDRDTRFISTTAWADNRFGLTAGETLKLGLLQMESSFLARHERRLEITRTLSLKQLLKEQANEDDASADALWAEAVDILRGEGELAFALKPSTFDRDYPGHYLRQLVRVSVSLPVVLAPYQDVHVTLSQQASSYLLKPQIGNVKHMYRQAGELPEGGEDEDIRQDQIVYNPRPNQQIGLSSGLDDHGMFVVDFGDERYYPFEGTGAVSSWTLSFPNHDSPAQQALLDTLNDVIVHVRYLAVDGGQAFAQEVEALL